MKPGQAHMRICTRSDRDVGCVCLGTRMQSSRRSLERTPFGSGCQILRLRPLYSSTSPSAQSTCLHLDGLPPEQLRRARTGDEHHGPQLGCSTPEKGRGSVRVVPRHVATRYPSSPASREKSRRELGGLTLITDSAVGHTVPDTRTEPRTYLRTQPVTWDQGQRAAPSRHETSPRVCSGRGSRCSRGPHLVAARWIWTCGTVA